jgi:hypothetical protein
MFTSDHLIFLELYKGGVVPIRKLLESTVGGSDTKDKPGAPEQLAASGKPIVGFVCEPKTWYLTQWQQGCRQQGDIYRRLTDEKRWEMLRNTQEKRLTAASDEEDEQDEGGSGKKKPPPRVVPPQWNADYAREIWYRNDDNVDAFREWLKAVIGTRGMRKIVDPAHAKSRFSKAAGPMTYRYFSMFVRDRESPDYAVNTLEGLQKLDAAHAITKHFVRSETAADDLPKVLKACGIALPAEQTLNIAGSDKKGPRAGELLTTFYDASSEKLVGRQEMFLIDKFGYGNAKASSAPSA